MGPVPAPSSTIHLALSQSIPSIIFRAMGLELGANEAILRPCLKNAFIINHQSGPRGMELGAAPCGSVGGGFGLDFGSADGGSGVICCWLVLASLGATVPRKGARSVWRNSESVRRVC